MEAINHRSKSEIVLAALRSAAVFPLEPRIRTMSASVVGIMGLPPLVAMLEIRRALEQSPNAPRLLFWRAIQQMRDGDPIGSSEAIARLYELVPDWAPTKRLEELFAERFGENGD
jgi:hypothetical protein